MKYNKLVRDRIPEIIRSQGRSAKIHIATDTEYNQRLKDKLSEEVTEFLQAIDKKHSTEELADILEVIDAIIDEMRINRVELQKIKTDKQKERGGFTQKIILEES